MRTILSILTLFTSSILFSQTKISDANVSVEVDPVFDQVTFKMKASSDTLNTCTIFILNSKGTIVKSNDLPFTRKQMVKGISFSDLGPGQFSYSVHQGKEKIGQGEFLKDAILMEPQVQPVVRRTEN